MISAVVQSIVECDNFDATTTEVDSADDVDSGVHILKLQSRGRTRTRLANCVYESEGSLSLLLNSIYHHKYSRHSRHILTNILFHH